jgi:D-amino peptidase
MKVYISVDIEGVAGSTHWDETEIGKEGYQEFREQMTVEAAAACEGALNAGATEILVKDAHWSARNIYPERLPEEARLIRGWNGEPFSMIQGLDGSFDAAAMVGYHSGAGAGGNPLAHTMTDLDTKILINGELTSEYLLHRNAAAMRGVPVVFLAGDKNLCDTAMATNRAVHTVATKDGAGGSTTSIHPMAAAKQIRGGMEAALRDEAARVLPTLAEHFEMEVWFGKIEDAYLASHFPGASLHDPHCVVMETDDYYEIGRMLHFVL